MKTIRRANRMDSDYNLVIKKHNEIGEVLSDVVAKNISLSGISFQCKSKLECNTLIVIDMNFGDICISDNLAEVKRIEKNGNEYCYGCKFIELSELKNEIKIKTYSNSII